MNAYFTIILSSACLFGCFACGPQPRASSPSNANDHATTESQGPAAAGSSQAVQDPLDALRESTRAAIGRSNSKCRTEAVAIFDALEAFSSKGPIPYKQGSPVALSLLRWTAESCTTSLDVTSAAASLHAFRLLMVDSSHYPIGQLSSPDASTSVELALIDEKSELPEALNDPLPTALSARLEFARALRAGDVNDRVSKLQIIQTKLLGLGLIADAFQCFIEADGVLASANMHKERLPLLREASQTFSHEPILTASVDNRLAVALDMTGDYEGALATNQAVVARLEPILGMAHPRTRRTLSNIAVVLARLGRTEEALQAQLEVLKQHEISKDDPSGWAVSHEAVAGDLMRLGRNAEAAEHCRKAIEVRSTMLPADHPDAKRGERCLAAAEHSQ